MTITAQEFNARFIALNFSAKNKKIKNEKIRVLTILEENLINFEKNNCSYNVFSIDSEVDEFCTVAVRNELLAEGFKVRINEFRGSCKYEFSCPDPEPSV